MTVDDELIAKYLSGEATPEEAMALDDWLGVPSNKARFETLEATWNQVNPSAKTRLVNKEEAWRKVKPPVSLGLRLGIAASILIVITAGIWTYRQMSVAELSVATIDSTRNIALVDQSNVTLFRNSAIEYPERFKGASREVKLVEGEAFFSIKKDPSRPFIVHASFADIKVIGTQFNVAIREDGVEISVDEGRVLVTTSTDSLYITKGSSAIIRANEKPATKEMDANTWAYASQKLVFKDTPINDVIKAVEKSYACTIFVSNDNVKNCKFTGTFDKDSVDEIVLLISESLNLKLEENGKVFILEGEGCP